MDVGFFTLDMLIDQSKAFDSVDQKLLLLKMESYSSSIRVTLSWFESHLSNRKQRVIVDNYNN